MASIVDQLNDVISMLNSGSAFGIDIGNHSVKVAEISGSKGKYKLEKFGSYPIPEAALIDAEIAKPEEILDALKEAIKIAGIKTKMCNIGLFGPNTMTKRISVPSDDEELEDTIIWESSQYISFGADDSEVDYHVIGNTEGGGKDVLVVAARNDLVEKFQNLIESAKLKIKIVDLNVVAISNFFEEVILPTNPDYNSGTAIIDYGSQSIKIVIYKNNGPIFTKEIPFGGTNITEEIQRQLAISYAEAEDLKSTVDDQGNPPHEVAGIIDSILNEQIAEIKRNLNFYLSAGSAEPISYCFVTGGCSKFSNLPIMLSQALAIDVQVLNPFEMGLRCDNSKIKKNIENVAATCMVVSGLGLRK